MSKEFKVGDEVRWSAKFLRSIVDYSQKSATAHAVVSELSVHDDPNLVRLTNLCGMPAVVNKNNLIGLKEIEHD